MECAALIDHMSNEQKCNEEEGEGESIYQGFVLGQIHKGLGFGDINSCLMIEHIIAQIQPKNDRTTSKE